MTWSWAAVAALLCMVGAILAARRARHWQRESARQRDIAVAVLYEARRIADGKADRPSFTCPRCLRTSFHPDDVRERYCGACHDWTGGELP